MFSGFPSYRPAADEADVALESYLDVVRTFSDATVIEACRRFRHMGASAFPPSAPQLVDACAKIDAGKRADAARAAPRLPRYVPPVDRLPPEEREASKARVRAMVEDFKREVWASRIEER